MMGVRHHTLFCDESGNTGPHFDSAEQPIYTEGGWIVADDDRVTMEERFLELESAHKFTAKTKATRLKDSPRGRTYLTRVSYFVGLKTTPLLASFASS